MSTFAPTLDSWIAAVARSDRQLWTPRPNKASRTRLAAYALDMEARYNRRFASYRDAHEWSVDSPAEFWRFVWSFTGVIGDPGASITDLSVFEMGPTGLALTELQPGVTVDDVRAKTGCEFSIAM